MNKLSLIFIFLLLWSCEQQKQTASTSPNIIFILADDLGYNDISAYRKLNQKPAKRTPTCQTPNIDQLVNEGLQFSNFYGSVSANQK